MIKALKYIAIFSLITFSCSIPISRIKTVPAANDNVIIEGFRLYHGMIFIIKSEMICGNDYWDTSNGVPHRKRVWVEIYIAENNRIVLYKIISTHKVPATPEYWEFDDLKKEIE